MRRPRALLALLAAAVLGGGCSLAPPQPDVLLVSIDRLDWSRTALDGGAIAVPKLQHVASDATRFEGLVSPAPGGPPAALTLLSGRPPAEHGLRRLDGSTARVQVPTLGGLFERAGYSTGAFVQAPLFGGLTELSEGFEAWMMPPESVPWGLPGLAPREPAQVTAASAQHWLVDVPEHQPAFAWVHFDAPVRPGLNELDAAAGVAELDRHVGLLVDQLELRAASRAVRPVVVVVSLAGQGEGAGLDEAFLLDEQSLRVRAIARLPGLEPGRVEALAGVDEIHDLLAGVVEPARPSRLRELAAGGGARREAVIAETQLPMTALGAAPLMRAVRSAGEPAPDPDPLLVQALSADPGWPGGFRGPAAAAVVEEWRTLHRAARELQAGGPPAGLEELAARDGGRARSARFLLALARAIAGDREAARRDLRALAESVPPADPAHRQALLALGELESGAGRPEDARAVLERVAAQHPDDLTALIQLAAACEQDGDSAAALAGLSRALEAHPRDARVLSAVAGVHAARGRFDLASQAYQDALRRRPVDGSLLLATADTAVAAGDPWTALEVLGKAQEVFGESAEMLHRSALVYHGEQRWTTALALHSRALDRDPGHEASRLGLADALLRVGNEDEGRAFLAVARARSPQSSEACRVLLAWLLEQDRRADAGAELESCLADHPQSPDLQALAAALAGS